MLLSSSSRIGLCDDIILDPSASLGDGNRPWYSISWAVSVQIADNYTVGATVEASQKEVELLNILNAAYPADSAGFRDIGSTLTITNDNLFDVAAFYEFSLTLTNFFGEKGMSSVNVSVLAESAVPRVKLAGINTNVKYRWQKVRIFR